VSDDPTQSTPVEPVWSAPAAPITPSNAAEPPNAVATPPSLEPVRPVAVVQRRSSSGRWLNVLLGIAAAVAIGGIAFAFGRSTAPATAAADGSRFRNGAVFPGGSFDPNASFAPGRGGNGPGFFTSGGLTIEGTVTSVTGDKMTITTDSGRTVEVALDADTEYHEQAAASASDVKTGSKVAIELDLAGGRAGNDDQGNQGGAGSGPTGTASDVTVIP
jgi:hypothetical protein